MQNQLNALMLFSFLIYSIQIQATKITYVCNSSDCHIENKIKDVELDQATKKILTDRSKEIVHYLLAKGIESVSGLSLSLLSSELDAIKWHIVSDGYLAPQGRLTGFMYNVEKKEVYIQADMINKISENQILKQAISLIFLHESLGALGYLDEDYEISAFLNALTYLNESQLAKNNSFFKSNFLKTEKRQISPSGPIRTNIDINTKYILAGGGSTTVGGGGDPLMALIKSKIIALTLQENEPVILLKLILSIRFERPVTYFDKSQTGLVEICHYPLSFEDFTKSVGISLTNNRTIIILNADETSPLYKIEWHFLSYIKKIARENISDEKQ